MARRRRMEFKQTGRSGRRSGVPESFDRVFISRRMLLAKAAIVAGFATLAGRLGFMQIVAHDAAVEDAKGNTQSTKTLPAPRGLIYDRQGRLLAKNETAFQVEIVPDDLPPGDTPSSATERRRVLDRLIAELELPDALVIDPSQIPDDQKDEIYATIAHARGRSDVDVAASVQAIRDAEKQNYLVLLEDDLSIDDAARWRLKCHSTTGLNVMNILDYQLGNTTDTSKNAIVVKTDVGRETAMRIEANRLYLPGVRIDDSVLVRRYPAGTPMSHLLGFVGPVSKEDIDANLNEAGNPIYANNDRIGKDGLEKQLEATLRGQKGYRKVLRDAIGNEIGIAPGSENFNHEPTAGDSVTLTIDQELQAAATVALKSFIEFSTDDRRAKKNTKDKQFSISGAVVAMDPRNGEVLALVSFPQYDNRQLANGISQALWKQLTGEDAGKPYFNRAIASAQPPGSTFKSFLAAASLHSGTLTPETTYVCTGGIGLPLAESVIEVRPYPCWAYNHQHGALTLHEALKTSCDVFFYNVGTKSVEDLNYVDLQYNNDGSHYDFDPTALNEFSGLGIDLIHKELTEKFWFSQTTNIELAGESTGLIPSQEWLRDTFNSGWSAGDTIITSIGQGNVQVTPLQMAANTVALANGGTIYTPTLIRETIKGATTLGDGGTPEADSAGQEAERIPADPIPPLRKMAFKPEHIDPVREGMLAVVNEFEYDGSNTNGSVSYVTMPSSSGPGQVEVPELAWPRTNPPGTAEEDRILIAGKTGTAEVEATDEKLADVDEKTGKYNNQHAWFTCFAPYDEPEIVVSVLLEYGGEGGTYAAPCADVILRAYFELTGKRKRDQTIESNGEKRRVSVLAPDKQPILNIETAESLTWFKPGETANTAGNTG